MRLKKITRTNWTLIVLLILTIGVIGCATQPIPSVYDPPGFLMGLVHGFCILFSLIGSIFTDVRIYAFPNSGGWYDFGYFLSVIIFLGAGGASAA